MTGAQQVEIEQSSRPRSGYGRLRIRHRDLIADHEALKAEHRELLAAQSDLQGSIDRLLEQHKRLMQSVRSPAAPQPWFEGANQVLAQLSATPEPRALQVMAAALAGIQQRLAQIIMRVPAL
jgi:uncharacterized protein (DUF3084 family)